jgi:outer membrane receptor protein involved in Fe transport
MGARAQPPPPTDLDEEAELHLELGVESFRQQHYATALEHLLLSNRLAPNPNVVFNIARTYEQMRKFSEAYRHYMAFLEGEPDAGRREPAQRALERIRSQVALVRVTTEPPGATVYLERRDLGPRGVAPRSLALTPGTHRVIVELEGFELAQADAELVIGREVELALELTPTYGTIAVEGRPVGAEIRVDAADGPVVGHVPEVLVVSPGDHALYVSAEGYRTAREPLRVEAKETTRAAVALERVTGVVAVEAMVTGALVEIDGQPVGFTPATVPSVPAGDHLLRVTREGFRAFEETITVRPDARTTVEAELPRIQEITAASRRTEAVEDALASVSLVPEEEIRAFGYQDVYDALAGTRGVYQTPSSRDASLGVRGFSPLGSLGRHLLVTLDGHTTNDDRTGRSFVGPDLLVDLQDVERIELVRGPGSAVYGSGAFSGVVNVVTRDGDSVQRPRLSVAANGVRTARASGGVSTAQGERGVWLSGGALTSQGDEVAFEPFADGADSATLQARAWSGDLTVQGYLDARDQRLSTGSDAHVGGTRAFLEARYEPKIGEKVEVFGRVYVDRSTLQGTYPEGSGDPVSAESWSGIWGGPEVRIVASPSAWLRLSGGAELVLHPLAELHETWVDADASALEASATSQRFSSYATVDVDLADRFAASIGGRVDASPSAVATWSPQAALQVWLDADDRLAARFGQAYRGPSAYEIVHGDDGPPDLVGASLAPETIVSGEGEYTHAFSDVTSVVGAVYYNAIRADIEESLADNVNIAGLEIEARRDWRQGYMVCATQSVQRATAGTGRTGEAIPNAPELLTGVKAAAPIRGAAATLATRLRWETDRLTALGTASDPVLLWDVTASGHVPGARLDYAAGVRNLFDWEYGWPGSAAEETVPQPGRTLFAEATLRF